jgi:hypothetical protein
MPLHPSLALVLAAVLGIAMACVVMAVGVLWARVRALPVDETTRLVDDLARRQQSIEVLLSRLDVGRGPAMESPREAGSSAVGAAGVEAPPGQRVDPAAATAVGGPTLIAVPSLSASDANASTAVAEELGRRFGAIWALADAGETAEAIARTTGHPVGQVELIFGLRRQLSQSSQPGGHA